MPHLKHIIYWSKSFTYAYRNIYASPILTRIVRFSTIYDGSQVTRNHPLVEEYVQKLISEYKSLEERAESSQRFAELKPLIEIIRVSQHVKENIKSLDEIFSSKDDTDKELQLLANEEKKLYEERLVALDEQLIDLITPKDLQANISDAVLELSAGVGGQEAMLFVKDLFDMYSAYILFNGWEGEVAEFVEADAGGVRHATILVTGKRAYQKLRYEAGVHRVQRIPATEKSGRVHTSTASVAVLPQPSQVEVVINNNELKIETKRAKGPGGQNVNKTDSAVRITHLPTGIAVECQVDRTQVRNKIMAMQRLRAILYQKQVDEQLAKIKATRKSQIGFSSRSEKIRTYNYNQDRITDHRLDRNFHCMEEFLSGGQLLEDMIYELHRLWRRDMLLQAISEL